MQKKPESETELAKDVIEWLTADGWEVFQEVPAHGHVADIVAKRGPLVWIIEAKVSFGLAVIEQASNWVHYANLVSVAVPYSRKDEFKRQICSKFGVGVLVWRHEHNTYANSWKISETIRPEFCRKTIGSWEKILKEQHKTFCAAGSTGQKKRFTPFVDTCQQLVQIVTNNPGITLKNALLLIKHHYKTPASARASILHYIENRIIGEIRAEFVNKEILLYIREKTGNNA